MSDYENVFKPDPRFKPVRDKKIKTMLERGEELSRKKEKTLLEEFEDRLKKSDGDIMLELGHTIGKKVNTFKPKKEKKKKFVEEVVEIQLGDTKDDDDKFNKLIYFSKKYSKRGWL